MLSNVCDEITSFSNLNGCIVGYLSDALWDLLDGSIDLF